MNDDKRIAVLMTCYNRKEKTLACLNSLFKAVLPENYIIEVFLVDDGSTDGTGKEVKKKFSKIRVIESSGNLFWNRGMHLAWECAVKEKDFDFYLWLNDDVILLPNALIDLLAVYQEYPDGIYSGVMRSFVYDETTYGGEDKKGKLLDPNGLVQKVYKFHGNLVLIPKKTFSILGNLDKVFHHAIGDFDYSLRAEKANIDKFISTSYSGYCDKHETLPMWCLPEFSLKRRMKSLYSPLGNSHPYYFFIYENRHFGLYMALKHFLSIHLRVLFPSLWKTKE